MDQIYRKRLFKSFMWSIPIGIGLFLLTLYPFDGGRPTVTFKQIDPAKIEGQGANYRMEFEEHTVGLELEHQESVALSLEGGAMSAPRKELNQVKYQDVYQGVDWVFYDKKDGNIGYDFVIEPGADPNQVRLNLEEVEGYYVNNEGSLVIPVPSGEIHHSAPTTYQEINGKKVMVESAFQVEEKENGATSVGFEIGDYDTTHELIIDPTIAFFACAITLDRLTVSGCYLDNSGNSKATVSVEVGWTMAPVGESIEVSLGAQTHTIDLNIPVQREDGTFSGAIKPLISPQVVSFEIDADGAGGTIDATFSTTTSCNNSINFTAPANCDADPCPGGSGVLGGTVYADNNFDGIRQAGETSRIEGVSVRIYECDGDGNSVLVDTQTSDAYGDYYFTGLDDGASYRIEFDLPAGLNFLEPVAQGTDNETNVTFVNAPACGVDFGVIDPIDYSPSNPLVFTPCYVNGDRSHGTVSGVDALVAFSYSAEDLFTDNGQGPSTVATVSEVGALWGLGYNRATEEIYSAAVIRRHSDLGPLGMGGIYVTDVNTMSTQTFIDLNADLGINVFDPSDPLTRDLAGKSLVTPNHDVEAFEKVGKIGIGDIDFNFNGDTMYVMNLYLQTIHAIDFTDYNANGTLPTAGDVTNFVIPDPGCTNGTMRPWALKSHKGKVYVGVVCDASTGTESDLRAIVYEMHPSTGAFVEIFNFPLTYPKGAPFTRPISTFEMATQSGWYPWTDVYTETFPFGIGAGIHPTPILMDIDFDIDGSMVMAFGDRTAMQWGFINYAPDINNTTTYNSFAGGDLLRAFSRGNTFILENNAKAGPATGAAQDNFQGPGNGEFYEDNMVIYANGAPYNGTIPGCIPNYSWEVWRFCREVESPLLPLWIRQRLPSHYPIAMIRQRLMRRVPEG